MTASPAKRPQTTWQEIKFGAARVRSVLFALIFKELKIKLGNGRLGILWVLLEPVVSMLMISTLWLIIGRSQIENTHVMLFVGSGFVIFLIVRRGFAPIPMAIAANQALLNYPQVKPLDTILARYILEMWLHSIAGTFLFFSLWWILDVLPKFSDPLECVAAILTAMLLSLGISVVLGIYATFYEGLKRAVGIVTQPLMILSSVIYSFNDLPPSGRDVLSWNPIVHIISSFRHGAFGTELFVGHNLYYPAATGLVLLGLGFLAYYANRFKLIQS